MIKILFCDIDGTLTETISGLPFKQSPEDIKPLPGAQKAVENYAARGYKVIGVSNQGGVDFINPQTQKHFKSLEDTIQEMRNTLALFPGLESIYFCPKMDGKYAWYVDKKTDKKIYEDSWDGMYRKPNIGMIGCAIWDVDHNREIHYPDCYIVGDRKEDMELAENANISFLNADAWRSKFL